MQFGGRVGSTLYTQSRQAAGGAKPPSGGRKPITLSTKPLTTFAPMRDEEDDGEGLIEAATA